jgi:hypothetical protein
MNTCGGERPVSTGWLAQATRQMIMRLSRDPEAGGSSIQELDARNGMDFPGSFWDAHFGPTVLG